MAPYFLFAIYKLLQLTWRIEIHELEEVQTLIKNKKSFILAHWHGDELGILPFVKKYHVACIVSTSKDGQIMSQAVKLFGGETVRGSSTRGGATAIKGLLRLKKQGWRPSIAVDGPKGPIYQVKPGVFQISRLTQLPVFPMSFHASHSYCFEKAWNKSKLPLPFAKVTVRIGEMMPALAKSADPKDPVWARELKIKLDANKTLVAQKI